MSVFLSPLSIARGRGLKGIKYSKEDNQNRAVLGSQYTIYSESQEYKCWGNNSKSPGKHNRIFKLLVITKLSGLSTAEVEQK